jgi:hypothetical protein
MFKKKAQPDPEKGGVTRVHQTTVVGDKEMKRENNMVAGRPEHQRELSGNMVVGDRGPLETEKKRTTKGGVASSLDY